VAYDLTDAEEADRVIEQMRALRGGGEPPMKLL
jgi:hypothetical protein